MKKLFTIGFTQKSAEEFFSSLEAAGVRRVIDVRLHNTGQLAGFTKREDLEFFLRAIGDIGYIHVPELAPTADMLRAYRDGADSWETYARQFSSLIKERRIEKALGKTLADKDCLLCSEPTPVKCHRRLVAEYLQKHWKGLAIQHL